ncbi:hypothetical protein [Mycobacteroides abscessus]|uniref:hypothetical protein n=1 Tax=Mycobacteroides abscessus TaxID=36809 RepID=UPI0005DF339D|nr:hypothetical protein [Mycobacteroides abscessus]CPR79423.1 Uncharacterised protein [Mycobacteroides abscessus]CPR88544.1 Uncharacterised protein [Mycobacteroides abscessus]CPS43478.1 Uncharacterised protein [Mycobacteroides abscessus]CPV03271.1 Uncharacterised protein [Mycobacteroides abscessus]
MARDYARIRLSINEDDEFEALTADAQWLYTRVLLPEPSLSYCGVADWRPKRLVGKAKDMTLDRILAAAAVLERERFVLFDLDTEEVLVRTYVRGDGLLSNPKMAAAVVKAYAGAVSKPLRAAIITEVKRVRSESPELTSWTNKSTADDLARLLTRPDAESVGYAYAYPVPNGNGHPVPISNRNTNQNGNPDRSSDYQSKSVGIPSTSTSTSTPVPLGELPKSGTSPAESEPDPNNPPPTHCPSHPGGTNDPCRACGDARERRLEFDRANSERQRAQREAEQQAALEAKLAAIALCDICNDEGYNGGRVCDHVDRTQTARDGIAKVRAALGKDDDQ